MRVIATIVVLLFIHLLALAGTPPRPLEELKEGKYLTYKYNDGDSFKVSYKREGKRKKDVFRLYFVDAIEARDKSKDDQNKLADQAQYFGVAEQKRNKLKSYGEQATTRIADLLAKPFTVYTAFAESGGRAKGNRYYAMITTADGRDLAEILVQEGLATVKGKKRKRFDGSPGKQFQLHLRNLERQAAQNRKGAWKLASDARISELQKHSP
ncbi:MAG TPA: thermonuclease family protein [Chthoniobacterales bacterium]|nr:thermonuclease family protein [Chthoniobacterales bacterium]